MSRKAFFILRGLPGVGKTTFTNYVVDMARHDGLLTMVVSKDQIRERQKVLRGMDTWTFSQEDELIVEGEYLQQLGVATRSKHDIVIVDNTNVSEDKLKGCLTHIENNLEDDMTAIIHVLQIGTPDSKSREGEPGFSEGIIPRMRQQMRDSMHYFYSLVDYYDIYETKSLSDVVPSERFLPGICLGAETYDWSLNLDRFVGYCSGDIYDYVADWIMKGYEIGDLSPRKRFKIMVQ